MIIEKNIPIPGARSQNTIWPFRQMEVGDSVLVPEERADNARVIASRVKKTDGFRFTSRKVEGGTRIWRIA
jgi:hypothetical protein